MVNPKTLISIQKATGMAYSDEQSRLISSEGGACVLACAGSGKTTAMTHLIARRLIDKSIRSGRRILGVTFSKTGATEMDERLAVLLELLDIDATVKMKTLHAFCLEFLKDIGAMRGRVVMDEYDKLNVMRELGRKYTKGFKYEDAEKIAGLITLQRGSMRPREEFITSVDFRSTEMESLKYVTVYDAFKKYKADNNLIDFDDMLLLAHYKLKQSPFYGEDFMGKYECVMVDEAQDMSVLQYRIVFQLLGRDTVRKDADGIDDPADMHEHCEHVRKTLVLIGDDDQCQPAGTQVTMSDGSFKNIEDLVVGDEVRAYTDVCCAAKSVTDISARDVSSLIKITTLGGHSSRYTDNHHCLVLIVASNELHELRADKLIVGMYVAIPYTNNSGEWRYERIKHIEVMEGEFTVYGLAVADYHTYVADGILTHNCIYEWMGSEPLGLSKAMDGYRLPLYTLSTNYRCPENVLSAAARCIAHNEHSIPKSMNAHKEGGRMLYQRVSGSFASESKYVADKIKEALDAGEEPSSIAVLSRNGAHTSLVWLYLTCYGIKSRLFGGQSTGSGDLIKHIALCFRTLTSTADAGNVLYALLGGNRSNSDKISALINMVDGTFQEWLEYIISTFVPKLGVDTAEDNAYASAGKTWKEAMREYYLSGGLGGNPMEYIKRLYAVGRGTPREFYLEILDIYALNMAWKYRNEDAERIFLGTLQAFRQLLTEDAERAIPMLESLDKHKAPNKKYITLSTAHSAKGREWNTVYIVCDDNLAFPSAYSIEMMRNSGDPRAVKRFIEAERRLHYVAMTRAKDTLCIVGGAFPPGMFLREALYSEAEDAFAVTDE